MKLINININNHFHMIPLWKSPIATLGAAIAIAIATRGAARPRSTKRGLELGPDPPNISAHRGLD